MGWELIDMRMDQFMKDPFCMARKMEEVNMWQEIKLFLRALGKMAREKAEVNYFSQIRNKVIPGNGRMIFQ